MVDFLQLNAADLCSDLTENTLCCGFKGGLWGLLEILSRGGEGV